MGALDDRSHAVVQDVGIELRRRNVRVTEKHLKRAQVGAAGQHMGCESVAQDVGADASRIDPGLDRKLLQKLAQTLSRQVTLLGGRGGKEPLGLP